MNRESFDIPGHVHFLTFSCLKKQRLLAAVALTPGQGISSSVRSCGSACGGV